MQDSRPPSPPTDLLQPEEVVNHSFATVRRGLEPEAVRRHLEHVAAAVRRAQQYQEELAGRLVEAERRAAAPPQLDEAALTAALGAETARVLQAAHQAAGEVLARAEQRAAELTREAEGLLARRTEEAEARAAGLLDQTRQRAQSLLEETREECRAMVEEAREARHRILAALAGRRRELHVQLEQIRAAKDSLAGIVDGVAEAVDQVRARLSGSEEEAQEQAEEAARTAEVEGSERPLDALVAEALAELPEEQRPPAEPPDYEPAGAEAPDAVFDVEAEPSTAGQGRPAAEAESALDEELPAAEPAGEAEPSRDEAPLAAGPASESGGEEGPAMEEGPAGEAPAGEPVTGAAAAPPAAVAGPASAFGEELSGGPATAVVDELFARIRASRAEEVAQARAVLEEGEPSPAPAPNGQSPEAVPASDGEPGADGEGGGDRAEGPASRRDELLSPAGSALERAVKRLLRSEQNELLDVARRLQGSDASELLPGEEAAARLSEAVRPALASAWTTGEAFLSELLGEAPGGEAEPEEAALQAVADELAGEVVGRIRAQLEQALAGGGEESFGPIVGLAYREWRGERVELLAGDFATRAFSAGVLRAAAARGALVRWALDDSAQPCPDCDDNALAEPQPPGEAFPTGQPAPPVHPGCRCLLLPVATG